MRHETITLYKFNELSDEAKQSAINYVRDNWHDLGQHCIDEMVDSLKALEKAINGDLDYAVSIVPDRGECVRMKDYDKERLKALYLEKDNCPLTGVCYDIDVIEGLYNGELESAVLNTLHREGEYIYGDDHIAEMLTTNEYEFLENGKRA